MSEVKELLALIAKAQRTIPVDVEGLISDLGVTLSPKSLPVTLSSSLMKTENGYEISICREMSISSQRFAMAHSLAHFIFHRSLVDQVGGVDDDRAFRSIPKHGDIFNDRIREIHEKQASGFAANLLVPEAALREAVKASDGYTDQSVQFQVSMQLEAPMPVVAQRMRKFDLLTDHKFTESMRYP